MKYGNLRKVASGKHLQTTTTGRGVTGSSGRLNRKTNAKQEVTKITRA